jgi:hypothetical protein
MEYNDKIGENHGKQEAIIGNTGNGASIRA